MLSTENVLAALSSEPLAGLPQNTVEREGEDDFAMLVWILGAVSATEGPENLLTAESALAGKWGSLWFSSGLHTYLAYVLPK